MADHVDLSSADARRVALSSLGFGVKRPVRAGPAHVRATAARLSAVQFDWVNVLARAHYLPTFSLYGRYPMSSFADMVRARRALFECRRHAPWFLPSVLYLLRRR